jgi:uncharacterized coiled-coil DUF342 family protein
MRLGAAAGEDPFSKVKGLITDMIATPESEAEEDASQKAYCDKEMSEATAKKDDLTAESDKLSTKIAQDKAASTKLKEEVATLQKELADMASAKAAADELRAEQDHTTVQSKAKRSLESQLGELENKFAEANENAMRGGRAAMAAGDQNS